MTTALQQAVVLLQLSAPELQDFIRQEAINNPLLEISEYEQGQEPEFESEAGHLEAAFDWNDYFSEESPYPPEKKSTIRQGQGYNPIDSYACSDKDLVEHLLSQLRISMQSNEDLTIGEYLIGNLDSYGYLHGEIKEFARILGAPAKKILNILRVIQKFEPSGVGARNLKECLLIQIEARQDRHPLAKKLVQKYVGEIAAGKYRFIAHELSISLKELQDILDFIHTLNPKPGSCIGGKREVRYIIPDVLVEKTEGEYYITVNDNIPDLYINAYYNDLFLKGGEKNLHNFIKKRLVSARWIIRCIEQRRITLYRVTQEIVRMQRGFLEEGIHGLKPLTMKELADALKIHESTVCRAAANKFVQTPRGLYPLKFFFTGGFGDPQGDVHSAPSIKTRLKQLIQNENPSAPYSDQELVSILMKEGIHISRRTITKYRRELDIPSTYRRRRV